MIKNYQSRALQLFILLLISPNIWAESVKTKVKSVSLFKNGLGYFHSTITLPKDVKNIVLGQLPIPVYGTFWVNYPKQVKLEQITTAMEAVSKKAPIQTLGELLSLNVGANVTIWTGFDEKQFLKGKVMNVVKRKKEPIAAPYFMGSLNSGHNRGLSMSELSNVLMLKTNQGVVALTIGNVRRVDFPKDNFIAETTIQSKKPSMLIQLSQPAPNKTMEINWLAKGITWTPSYRIDLSDPKMARLTAKALVINEVMDLNNVRLELISGFPNIQFGEVHSPIAMSEPLSKFLGSLSGDHTRSYQSGQRSQIMTQQAVMFNAPSYSSFESAPSAGYSSNINGKTLEDLFFYPIKNVTLRYGETAYLPLFSAKLPYSHIYIWKIKDYLDENNRYQLPPRSDDKLSEQIWHSARFINTLKMPLTTAAVKFIKKDKFVGQDICYYTPPNAKTTIRINRSMNILAEQAEFELERKRNAINFNGYRYDKVKVRGELKLTSHLNKTVKMEITKELSGEIIKTSTKVKDVKTAKGLRQINPKHNLIWEVDLNAGKTMKLEYVYQFYVRN